MSLQMSPLLRWGLAASLLPLGGCDPAPETPPDSDRPPLETVHTLGAQTPPGNIAISADGRMFVSLHEFFGELENHVVEIMPDGTTTPYPNEQWSGPPVDADGPGLNSVLGVRVDRDGILWMLDSASDTMPGRLVGWDTNRESLFEVIELVAPATTEQTFLNDIAVDRDSNTIYVADSSGALIVVDIATGAARRVLDADASMVPEDIDIVIEGRTIELGGSPARIGVNPITIDDDNTWLYFGPMSSTSLYRVRTADLRDASLSSEALAARVERYGDKPISDGSTIDADGNVYITSITDNSIGVTDRQGVYTSLYQSDELQWADGFSVGADGQIYVTVSELHKSPPLNGGHFMPDGEFKILRFSPLAPVTLGR